MRSFPGRVATLSQVKGGSGVAVGVAVEVGVTGKRGGGAEEGALLQATTLEATPIARRRERSQ